MNIAFFSAKQYEIDAINQANNGKHHFTFISAHLSDATANQAENHDAVCCFVTDGLSETVINALAKLSIQLIALRSAGFDHVDLAAAQSQKITVVNVPEYSPEAVAEFAAALTLSLSRKIPQIVAKSAAHNYLLDGLLGFNLHQKTVGIIGVGKIGTAFARIMLGFGCRVLVCDPTPAHECLALPVECVTLDLLLQQSDVISLHCPLNPKTKHIINRESIAKMKKGVMMINTGRGPLIETSALIDGLNTNQIGFAGLDVYEKEKGLFFEDHSHDVISDTQFLTLQQFPNVLITGHTAFFSQEALRNIARTTIENITAFELKKPMHVVSAITNTR